jgi:hypothetical protein
VASCKKLLKVFEKNTARKHPLSVANRAPPYNRLIGSELHDKKEARLKDATSGEPD